MYRSPLLLFYFLRNRIAMFSRHLIAACGFTAFIGMLLCLPLIAIAQTSSEQTSDSPAGSELGLLKILPAIQQNAKASRLSTRRLSRYQIRFLPKQGNLQRLFRV